jgi:hypothetical protein
VKYLGEIPFSSTARKKIQASIQHYEKSAYVDFNFSQMGEHMLHVNVLRRPLKDNLLSDKELTSATAKIFEGQLPAGFDVFITISSLNQ